MNGSRLDTLSNSRAEKLQRNINETPDTLLGGIGHFPALLELGTMDGVCSPLTIGTSA